METFDYTPKVGGYPADVQADGGAVEALLLYISPDRTGTPDLEVTPAVRRRDLSWRFTFTPPATPGRFYGAVEWTATSGGATQSDPTLVLDLPTDYDLVVSVESVAVALGVALPLTPVQRDQLAAAVGSAQADAEAYLNRPVTGAYLDTQVGLRAWTGTSDTALWDTATWKAYTRDYDDLVAVEDVTYNGDGSYDVTFKVGLDGRRVDPIRRYVLAHAVESIRRDPAFDMGEQRVSSVSAEGQSVSYAKESAAQGAAGSVPNVKTLSRYRRYSVYRRERPVEPRWPYYRSSWRR